MSAAAALPRRTVPFLLGDIAIFPASNEIARADNRVRVRPLLMEVLLRLVEQPGEVVPRDTLLAEVWPRRIVNDEVLSRTIAELREALGDDARAPRFIETLPKVGYRLVARVGALAEAGGPAVAASAPPLPAAVPPRSPQRDTRRALAVTVIVALAAIIVLVFAATRGRDDPARIAEALRQQLAAAQPLTAGPGLEIAARQSPDGGRVAFVEGDTIAGSRTRLVLRDVRSGERQVLIESAGLLHSPAWFPDGRAIAYYRATRGTDCAIVRRDLSSGAEQVLMDCTLAPAPRFDLARDGRTLVVAARVRPQQPFGLVTVDVASGAQRVLTMPAPGTGDDVHPRFSPDGRQLAFFRGTASHRQLWVMPVNDPAAARLAAQPRGLSYGAAWLDERRLLVAADWLGFRALDLVDLTTSDVQLLGARGARFPDVDRAGNIVYEQAQYHADVWRLPGEGDARASPEALWPSTRYTAQPEIAPDGRAVAVVSNRDGQEALYVGTPDAAPVHVALPENLRVIRPHWSADGRALYAVAIERTAAGEKQRAVRVTWPEGSVEFLPDLGLAVFDVRETANGSALLIGEQAEHAVRLWRAPRDRPAARERLPLPLASEYRVAGDTLLFAQPQLVGLTSCALATLACTPLPVPVSDDNRFEWATNDRAVYYRAADENGDRVQRFDLGTRTDTTRYRETPGSSIDGIAVSADDRALLVVRAEPPAVDVMRAPVLR